MSRPTVDLGAKHPMTGDRAHSHPAEILPGSRGGFTLVELIVAIVILTVGIVGMGGSTGWAARQVTLSDMTLERTIARQTVVERLKSTDFSSIAAGSESIGNFRIVWTLPQSSSVYKTAQIITTGPGLNPGPGGTLPVLGPGVTDTLTLRILGNAF